MTSFSNFFIKKKKKTLLETENEEACNENIEDLLTTMKIKGFTFVKVKSSLSMNKRNYYIDEDGLVIQYKGSQKVQCIQTFIQSSTLDDDILISHIEEIRDGAETDIFRKACSRDRRKEIEKRCFSLVYDGTTLDLVAETEQDKLMFIRGIKHLIRKSLERGEVSSLWIKELFFSADLNNDKKLSIKEVVQMMRNLNIQMDEFNAMIFMHKEYLDLSDFISFMHAILRRGEIIEIFKKYAGEKMYMTTEELQEFFLNEQKEKIDKKKCSDTIHTSEPNQEMKEKGCLTIDGFYSILTSELMNIMSSEFQEVYQDMTQPIVHYFIDSSHNTYLEGKQFNSRSQLETYIKVLKSGCRCVELDVWDGAEGPEIFHGYANTTRLLFSDVINTINKYAFRYSKYPVILSIENHCTIDQQSKMADCMKKEFAESLYIADFGASDKCPSPADLEGKIIVKCKKIQLQSDMVDLDKDSFNMLEILLENDDPIEISVEATDGRRILDKMEEALPNLLDRKIKKDIRLSEASMKNNISLDLSDCVSIFQTAKFINFDHSSKKLRFTNVCSFSETKGLKLVKKYLPDFIRHNASVMSRIYPSGTRLKSSNYNPQLFWIAGCQLVALNYQTASDSMFVNKGMFIDNGGCGYVLKPKYQRKVDKDIEFPNSWKQLDIKIISGFALPKKNFDTTEEILDPFIRVSLYDDSEEIPTRETYVIQNNGFNPVWNDVLSFRVRCIDLALVLFQVLDYSSSGANEVVAQFSMPFRLLKEGYRVIHLKNPQGHSIISQLLVQINIFDI